MSTKGTRPASVELVGNYYIKVKSKQNANEAEEVKIRFRMETADHLLLGIAFSRREFSGHGKVGELDFPSWTVMRSQFVRLLSR